MNARGIEKVETLVQDLMFDYDRLSSGGQKTLLDLVKMLNIGDATDTQLLEMGCPLKDLYLYR
tara:strand:+ start:579 stop:767 length:189 start_codon:yes stop_codon:yes gene_type:complete